LKLLRFATLSFNPALTELEARGFSIGGVSVILRDTRGGDESPPLLAIAETEIPDRPALNDANEIVLPAETLRSAERAIEVVANVLAVCERAQRSISSPHPPAALIPPDEETRRWLDASAGVAVASRGTPSPVAKVILDNQVMEALADRMDGAALLAEALSHAHSTGKFHEIIRVFERAFRLGPYDLIDPLAEFLASGPFGYAHEEVRRWVELRQPATHADRRSYFVLERDVQPVVGRMTQAAYDVLFNKKSWRDKSTERRPAWSPATGTSDPGTSMFVVRGTAASIEFQFFDSFGAYPRNLQAAITERPPEWWWHGSDERRADEAE
jgi:hypothetical protein